MNDGETATRNRCDATVPGCDHYRCAKAAQHIGPHLIWWDDGETVTDTEEIAIVETTARAMRRSTMKRTLGGPTYTTGEQCANCGSLDMIRPTSCTTQCRACGSKFGGCG